MNTHTLPCPDQVISSSEFVIIALFHFAVQQIISTADGDDTVLDKVVFILLVSLEEVHKSCRKSRIDNEVQIQCFAKVFTTFNFFDILSHITISLNAFYWDFM
ncbi:hypothetical protein XENOCAPTIV_011880 [Xenoophorus captivus]|uniref:Uncharacterized protein n=1 Tax=Xenoophorus captivus TaxID=1517983 RepID=A0ABV0QRE5_9TELE